MRRHHLSRWALVPVKAPAYGKSRLASVLEVDRRADLVERMLENVVAAALGAVHIDRVLVVSPVATHVPPSVLAVRDQGLGLIPALDIARRAAIHGGADRLLVLPADLPLVTAADIDGFAERARNADVAVAVDRSGSGTNGLWIPAARRFEFQFGADSARQHRLEARTRSLSFEEFRLPGLDFDIDTSSDLYDFGRLGGARFNPNRIGVAG
jgi:2-phospho-L-lactate guanylyltransferase